MVLKLGTDPINNLGSVSCFLKEVDFGLVLFSENKGNESDLYVS